MKNLRFHSKIQITMVLVPVSHKNGTWTLVPVSHKNGTWTLVPVYGSGSQNQTQFQVTLIRIDG
jgi:hypothetical protein